MIRIAFPETCSARVQAGVSGHPFGVGGAWDEWRTIADRFDDHLFILSSSQGQAKCEQREQEQTYFEHFSGSTDNFE